MSRSASNADFEDRAIILALEDNIDGDGYASTDVVARVLDLDARSLGVRLGWMRRYGLVERHPEKPGRWAATDDALDDTLTTAVASATARPAEFELLRRSVAHWQARRQRWGGLAKSRKTR